MRRPRKRNWFFASVRVIFPAATSSCSVCAMPTIMSTAVRIWATRSSIMRLWLSEADTATVANTVSAARTTMLASLVRIFNRLSRFIAETPTGTTASVSVSGNFLPILKWLLHKLRADCNAQIAGAQSLRSVAQCRYNQEWNHAEDHADQRERDYRIVAVAEIVDQAARP